MKRLLASMMLVLATSASADYTIPMNNERVAKIRLCESDNARATDNCLRARATEEQLKVCQRGISLPMTGWIMDAPEVDANCIRQVFKGVSTNEQVPVLDHKKKVTE